MNNISLSQSMMAIEQASASRAFIPSRVPFIAVRFDGKTFGRYTKKLDAPEDAQFTSDMNETAMHIVNKMVAVGGLVVSDEISIILRADKFKEFLFGGNVAKLTSIGAATVSTKFAMLRPEANPDHLPVFDGRVIMFANAEEVRKYILFRRRLASKNAISMVVKSLLPGGHKQAMGLSTDARVELLQNNGIDINDVVTPGFVYGRTVKRGKREMETTYVDKRSHEEVTAMAMRSFTTITDCEHPGAPEDFSVGGYFRAR